MADSRRLQSKAEYRRLKRQLNNGTITPAQFSDATNGILYENLPERSLEIGKNALKGKPTNEAVKPKRKARKAMPMLKQDLGLAPIQESAPPIPMPPTTMVVIPPSEDKRPENHEEEICISVTIAKRKYGDAMTQGIKSQKG